MPANLVKTPEDESLWRRAKAHAVAEGHAKDWPYVVSIFEKMKKGHEKKAEEQIEPLEDELPPMFGRAGRRGRRARRYNLERVLMDLKESPEESPEDLPKDSTEAAEPVSPPSDVDIARRALEEELKASTLYERLARDAKGPTAKLLRDVSEEEKVHAGEFRSLIDKLDPQSAKSDSKGEEEARDIVKKAVEIVDGVSGDSPELGPLGYPKGTGQAINRALGKPARGEGMLDADRARRIRVLEAMLAQIKRR